ncbi:MAG: XylR family transcriptional regulator [Pirellulaceae bacterium]
MQPRKQVAVLIDPADSWGKQVILGISGAVRHRLPWDLLIASRDDQWRFRVPKTWRGDGIIAAIRDVKTEQHIRSLSLPTVNVSALQLSDHPWYRVNTDDQMRAEIAFRHFRDRGFEHFAYYGPPSQRYPDQRGEYFRRTVSQAGFHCETFKMGRTGRFGWSAQREQALGWLMDLPRPLAVFAADPHPALQLSEVCRSAEIHVPEEVAILAGDFDDLLSEVSAPPLSSIVLGSEQLGVESVRMLSGLMRGQPPPNPLVLIPPIRVVPRESTDTLAISDDEFVRALRYIRIHAHEGLRVNDVLKVVGISRRLLELRFQKYLNRSPANEIRRVKLEHIKKLLVTTEHPIEVIALASGFAGSSQLCAFFRQATSSSPQAFRREIHRRDGQTQRR